MPRPICRIQRFEAVVAGCGLAIALLASGGCGGEGLDAPFSPNPEQCPEVDDYLAPVLELAHEDRFQHLRTVLSEDLSDSERHRLVELIIDHIGALEPGAISALGDVSMDSQEASGLEETLATAMRWVGEDGPGAPYSEAIEILQVALGTPLCKGQPLFFLLRELLGDEALLRSALDVMRDPGLDVHQLLDDLDSPDGDPRSGLRALLQNLMAVAMKPDFDVTEWTVYVTFIVADADKPPWSVFIAGLENFLVPGERLTALQELLGCVDAVDPEFVSSDLLYDLLTAPPELSLSVDDLAPADEQAPLIPQALHQPLDALLVTFYEDESARTTLATVLGALLDPLRVRGVLSDLTELFDVGGLWQIIDGMVAIATRSCAP